MTQTFLSRAGAACKLYGFATLIGTQSAYNMSKTKKQKPYWFNNEIFMKHDPNSYARVDLST
jgi:hypothetical protein